VRFGHVRSPSTRGIHRSYFSNAMSRGVGAGDSVAVCAGVCVDAGACVDTGADVGVMGVSSFLKGVSEWCF
jgi:hypothetical protein